MVQSHFSPTYILNKDDMAVVAQLVKCPEFRFLKEVQQRQHEFESRPWRYEKILAVPSVGEWGKTNTTDTSAQFGLVAKNTLVEAILFQVMSTWHEVPRRPTADGLGMGWQRRRHFNEWNRIWLQLNQVTTGLHPTSGYSLSPMQKFWNKLWNVLFLEEKRALK